jgi:hypothetical protein
MRRGLFFDQASIVSPDGEVQLIFKRTGLVAVKRMAQGQPVVQLSPARPAPVWLQMPFPRVRRAVVSAAVLERRSVEVMVRG